MTIRLDDLDIGRIEAIQKKSGHLTINGAIRQSLRENVYYTALLHDLGSLFTMEWQVDKKKLKALNHKYGFIQTNLFA